MTGKSHMRIAFSVSIFTANPVIIASAVLGSLIPDIDSPTSKLCQFLPFKGWPLSKLNHRGITHSLLSLVFVTALTYLMFHQRSFAVGIFIGYLSHIISDMMTVKGVELFWPSHKHYKLGSNIKTGSKMERGVVGIIVVLGFATAFKLWNWI